ncbi:hypothetical protein [Burkholderia thailandensis]|uniref:hypothetical protein n=1 Tax=Burkholderia thailandensis TaxID=57975 RepID=UPI0012DAC2F3|nr:hypothetical protein [Burkholderia thailandensis]
MRQATRASRSGDAAKNRHPAPKIAEAVDITGKGCIFVQLALPAIHARIACRRTGRRAATASATRLGSIGAARRATEMTE